METVLGLTLLGAFDGSKIVIVIIWIVLSYFIGKLSEKGTISFWIAFLVSLFLSPIVGLIIALVSIFLAKKK